MTGAERRAHPRVDTDLECLVDGETQAKVRNLSMGGALLVGPEGLAGMDDLIAVEISRPEQEPLSLLSQVVRRHALGETTEYGLSFVELEGRREELQRWIAALSPATGQRRVTGALFVDYVRMIRGFKGADWSKYLKLQDFRFLTDRIEPNQWYPMETFERMGLAILAEVAQGDPGLARVWGRAQGESVAQANPSLLAPGDPRDSLMRFQVLRNSFFDYAALNLTSVSDGEASMTVAYGMCAKAEEAASLQTLGFFERLVELSGGRSVEATFSSRKWDGHPTTTIELRWT